MIKDFFKTSALSLITLSLMGIAYAWTEPVSNPPVDNTKAPITVSNDTQYKSGLFSMEYLKSYGNTLLATDNGNVGIGTAVPNAKLDVTGDIRAGNSDLYFTKTDHNHTGIGNTAGYAAIENAANYDSLMILGRTGTDKVRRVKLWDYLQVNGGMDVTGNITAGGQNVCRENGQNCPGKIAETDPTVKNWAKTDSPTIPGKLDVAGKIKSDNNYVLNGLSYTSNSLCYGACDTGIGTVNAGCSGDKKVVIGGGCRISGFEHYITGSFLMDRTGAGKKQWWECEYRKNPAVGYTSVPTITAYAICADAD